MNLNEQKQMEESYFKEYYYKHHVKASIPDFVP